MEGARDLYVKGIQFRSSNISRPDIPAVLDPVKATAGGANGVFIDGTGHQALINCHYKTCGQDQTQCCVFSEADEQDYNEGLKLVKTTQLNKDNV